MIHVQRRVSKDAGRASCTCVPASGPGGACSLPWDRAGLRDALANTAQCMSGRVLGCVTLGVCTWNQPLCCEEAPAAHVGRGHVGRNRGPWPPAV